MVCVTNYRAAYGYKSVPSELVDRKAHSSTWEVMHQNGELNQRTISGPSFALKPCNPESRCSKALPTESGDPFTPNSM